MTVGCVVYANHWGVQGCLAMSVWHLCMFLMVRVYAVCSGLEVLNSFSFCLSVKLLISPSNLNESFNG